jgi:hypothetical protein
MKDNWQEKKDRLKQKVSLLMDSNILLIEVKQEELLGRLQVKLGKSKEEIQKIISEL